MDTVEAGIGFEKFEGSEDSLRDLSLTELGPEVLEKLSDPSMMKRLTVLQDKPVVLRFPFLKPSAFASEKAPELRALKELLPHIVLLDSVELSDVESFYIVDGKVQNLDQSLIQVIKARLKAFSKEFEMPLRIENSFYQEAWESGELSDLSVLIELSKQAKAGLSVNLNHLLLGEAMDGVPALDFLNELELSSVEQITVTCPFEDAYLSETYNLQVDNFSKHLWSLFATSLRLFKEKKIDLPQVIVRELNPTRPDTLSTLHWVRVISKEII